MNDLIKKGKGLSDIIKNKGGLYGRQKEAIEKYFEYAQIPVLITDWKRLITVCHNITALLWLLYHFIDKDIADRFRAEEEKHKQLTARRNRMEAESVSITELEETPAPPIEFDEKLWHAVVDRVTVYNDDRLVYSLKDGSEITVMLWWE